MTQAGTVMGTYPYMSPEQAQGQVVDARSDLFSLGIILYEMATGRRPFTGETGVSLISSILKDTPRLVTDLKEELPEELGAIIEKCLEKDPADRFDSADEVRDRLEALRRQVKAGQVGTSSRQGRLVLAASLVVVAALAGISGYLALTRQGEESQVAASETPGPRIASLAVLPLRNLSGDPEQEYFADGMTEALITDLSKIGALRVIARSSVMRYKGSDLPLSEIAVALGVDAVVEGSVVREGERVGISAQLIEVTTERILWGERYTESLTSILGLQAQVARAIAGGVRVTLSPEEEALLSAEREVDPAAYDAVLKGLFQLQQFNPRGFDAAEKYFEVALEIAPDYAPAYVGMARVWSYRNQFGLARPGEIAPLRRELIDRALALDDSLADAHLAEANYRVWYEFDWKGGEESFLRALEFNPNYAEARIFYSHLLTIVGRIGEAREQADRALDLDPLNPFFKALAGVHLSGARRGAEAIEMLRSALELAPDHPLARSSLWREYRRQGRLKEAFAELRALTFAWGDTEWVEALDRGWAEGGWTGASLREAEIYERRSASAYVGAYGLARSYDEGAVPEKAILWLEKAYEERSPNLPYVGIYPVSEELRSDPRFVALVEKMGLPVTSAANSGE
jgi:TolB-like protein